MKEQLLKIFQDHQGEYISGEKISQELGCSRTAVWKHIEELRRNGYQLDSAPRKGYRMVMRANGIHTHEIKQYLTTKFLGRELTYFDATESTQQIAHKLAQEGAEEGHVVVANEQTKGKGRLGRVWHSRSNTSISMSMILRPPLPPQKTPQLTLLAAVAVVQAIKKNTGLQCEIKWPNDILLKGKKLVGILTEMQADPDLVHSVIIGIGLNVNQTSEDFGEDIAHLATSLYLEKDGASGQPVDRARLIADILLEFEELYEEYLENGFQSIRPLWESYSISVGTYIYARMIKEVIYGYAKGITDDGVLLVEDESGKTHHIYSADIEIDPSK
ncbi:biotin--[acetyl-CoA-carboxylase] ligase [Alkalihalophilus marmarensis]|jgi:BirA family biotin operon repressor/biotin-[acetyl-CoA-carboxylase] ligase|uniref:Bifunctional ligase/repressor BirA n=1 Tax=Alkalihalophilus marmarensis DSM 21297 TaxID=1188261 RepID=U6SU70_9BACI|nr:biotin--[acetyl-CoA-carboxylase] ligase [Alkalihalophilus marmarensis]ERN54211.1 biotin--acetyl-CoA-carboxylase ligase [Alkalihalophilus marmarensis DSM 21297]MCM3488368.1 biotin--[acetyl-CoA-carboxylase] ligase [Alkalihalophilus marmarensis]